MCSQGKPISEGRWAGSAGRGPWWGSGNINRAPLLLLLTRRGQWPGQGGRGGADGQAALQGPPPAHGPSAAASPTFVCPATGSRLWTPSQPHLPRAPRAPGAGAVLCCLHPGL